MSEPHSLCNIYWASDIVLHIKPNWLNIHENVSCPGIFFSFHRSIYLGETFMSYVSLHNDSTETSDNVVLKCDLQTATQRLPILQSAQG